MAANASAASGGSTTAVLVDTGASTSQPLPKQADQQPGQQQPAQQPGSDSDQPANERLVLRLVPRKKKKKKAVSWTDDTVDNEGMGKKSSKKCCIFHANRPFGEWDDSDDSDSECRHDLPDGGDGHPSQGGGSGVPNGRGGPGPS